MLERIDAEYLGYFIALYACEMGEMGDIYLGHYKVFSKRPRDFWEHGELVADNVGGLCSTAKQAMAHAEDLARQRILGLPPRRRLHGCIDSAAQQAPRYASADSCAAPLVAAPCSLSDA